jgi:hypothetical protein
VAGAVLIAASGRAVAALLTFDDLGLPSGTILTNQYQAQGVVFAPLNGQLELRTASNPIFPGDPMGLAEIPYWTSVIFANFPGTAAVEAGAYIDFGNIGNGVKIEAFSGENGAGTLLGSASTTTETLISVSAAGIRSVKFSDLGPAGTVSYLIDHFTFTLAPAPGSVACVTAGAMLTARRRRR